MDPVDQGSGSVTLIETEYDGTLLSLLWRMEFLRNPEHINVVLVLTSVADPDILVSDLHEGNKKIYFFAFTF